MVWMFGGLHSGYAQVFSAPHSAFLLLGRAGHLPNLKMRVKRGTQLRLDPTEARKDLP